jgi:hypothetical protein
LVFLHNYFIKKFQKNQFNAIRGSPTNIGGGGYNSGRKKLFHREGWGRGSHSHEEQKQIHRHRQRTAKDDGDYYTSLRYL